MNDALLKRLERRALVLTGLAMGVALLIPGRVGGGGWMATSVLCGALLAATSYWAIKRGVTGLADAMLMPGRPRAPRGLVPLVLRYALLAGLAYVMIARLRMHPIGLLGGASVIPLAAIIEALRPRP